MTVSRKKRNARKRELAEIGSTTPVSKLPKINHRFNSWSPSRLADHDQCPFMAAHKHLLKTCPSCFAGKVMGGFETEAQCDTCGEVIVKGQALERGTEIGAALEQYIKCKRRDIHPEVRHPQVIDLLKEVRNDFKKDKAKVEFKLQFNKDWKVLPGEDWRPDTWLIVKLDVLRMFSAKLVEVIDWKTGGIDKRSGSVRVDPKYPTQLEIYSTAVLSAFPKIEKINSALVFLDCGPRFNPVVQEESGTFGREDLEKHQRALNRRVEPMLWDATFVPKPSPKCGWCPYSKEKMGPCPY